MPSLIKKNSDCKRLQQTTGLLHAVPSLELACARGYIFNDPQGATKQTTGLLHEVPSLNYSLTSLVTHLRLSKLFKALQDFMLVVLRVKKRIPPIQEGFFMSSTYCSPCC